MNEPLYTIDGEAHHRFFFGDGITIEVKETPSKQYGRPLVRVDALSADGHVLNSAEIDVMNMQHREQFARMAASVNGLAPEYLAPHLLFVAKQIDDMLGQSDVEGWTEPLPLPALLPDVPTMTADILPHGLRPWLTDIADRVQCPLEYVAISAMVAIAAIIGRRIGIYPKRHDDWLVIPNLWGMLIGRPGVLKSPAMVEAMKPLNRLVKQALQAHAKAAEEYAVASSTHEAKCKALKAQMSNAAKKGDNTLWPDTPATWTNVDRWPDTDAKKCAWQIFQRLAEIQREHVPEPDGVGFDWENPPGVRFAPPAQDIFDRWRSTLEARLRSGGLHPALESHLAKYQSLMPTLALLFHLTFHAHQDDFTDGCITPVTEYAATLAIRWCEFLEKHALRIYAGHMDREKHRAHALAKHICNGDVSDGDTVRSVYRKQWAMLRTPEDTYGALSVLESLHWVRLEAEKTAGRTRDVIRINPVITGEKTMADIVLTTDTTDESLTGSEDEEPAEWTA
jgi:hypothetical protein